jgi:hypothetical protein
VVILLLHNFTLSRAMQAVAGEAAQVCFCSCHQVTHTVAMC